MICCVLCFDYGESRSSKFETLTLLLASVNLQKYLPMVGLCSIYCVFIRVSIFNDFDWNHYVPVNVKNISVSTDEAWLAHFVLAIK